MIDLKVYPIIIHPLSDVKYKINEEKSFYENLYDFLYESNYIGEVVNDRFIARIQNEIFNFIKLYFEMNSDKYTDPGWTPICKFDQFSHSIVISLITRSGREISVEEAQYRIDKFGWHLRWYEDDLADRLEKIEADIWIDYER